MLRRALFVVVELSGKCAPAVKGVKSGGGRVRGAR